MNNILRISVIALAFGIAGCSGEDEEREDHVWQEQTETIDTAKQVEDQLRSAAEKQRKALGN